MFHSKLNTTDKIKVNKIYNVCIKDVTDSFKVLISVSLNIIKTIYKFMPVYFFKEKCIR